MIWSESSSESEELSISIDEVKLIKMSLIANSDLPDLLPPVVKAPSAEMIFLPPDSKDLGESVSKNKSGQNLNETRVVELKNGSSDEDEDFDDDDEDNLIRLDFVLKTADSEENQSASNNSDQNNSSMSDNNDVPPKPGANSKVITI